MNTSTAQSLVGALNAVTEALTIVAAHSLQAPETAPSALPRTSANAAGGIDNGDGTISFPAIGLMFSKATLTPKCISQHDATKLCAELTLAGHSDWRLPTRAELLGLVDDTRHQPAIDTALFPDTKSDWYWTSTACAWSSDHAWFVYFSNGYCYNDGRGNSSGLVRAVRSLSPGQ